MAMENAAQGHTTVDEEEVTIELNWQFNDSNNNGSKKADPMRTPRMNSVTYYRRGGLKKVQMNKTPIIFLRKRYGSVIIRIQS
jgi:hypothetical protein